MENEEGQHNTSLKEPGSAEGRAFCSSGARLLRIHCHSGGSSHRQRGDGQQRNGKGLIGVKGLSGAGRLNASSFVPAAMLGLFDEAHEDGLKRATTLAARFVQIGVRRQSARSVRDTVTKAIANVPGRGKAPCC